MVDYEFQASRIGRMSDYIDRRTATLGLHMACLEQQARELRRDAENMRCVVIGDSVDDPARMAGGHGTAPGRVETIGIMHGGRGMRADRPACLRERG